MTLLDPRGEATVAEPERLTTEVGETRNHVY